MTLSRHDMETLQVQKRIAAALEKIAESLDKIGGTLEDIDNEVRSK